MTSFWKDKSSKMFKLINVDRYRICFIAECLGEQNMLHRNTCIGPLCFRFISFLTSCRFLTFLSNLAPVINSNRKAQNDMYTVPKGNQHTTNRTRKELNLTFIFFVFLVRFCFIFYMCVFLVFPQKLCVFDFNYILFVPCNTRRWFKFL